MSEGASFRALLALAIICITAGGLLDIYHRRSLEVRGLGRIMLITGASILSGLIIWVLIGEGG